MGSTVEEPRPASAREELTGNLGWRESMRKDARRRQTENMRKKKRIGSTVTKNDNVSFPILLTHAKMNLSCTSEPHYLSKCLYVACDNGKKLITDIFN